MNGFIFFLVSYCILRYRYNNPHIWDGWRQEVSSRDALNLVQSSLVEEIATSLVPMVLRPCACH